MNPFNKFRLKMGKLRVVSIIIVACHLLGVACQAGASQGFIAYQRSGGFVGLDDKLVIDSLGKARLTQRGRTTDFQIAQDKLDKLLQLLETGGFARLNARYQASGNDLIEYQVNYKAHTVRAVDGAIPPELQPVLDALNEIVDSRPIP